MRIDCPHCGSRDSGEFVYRGDAAPIRPDAPDTDAFVDYVYRRDNPAGWLDEHWRHAQGCRQWLTVRRNTLTHEIASVALAAETGAPPGAQSDTRSEEIAPAVLATETSA